MFLYETHMHTSEASACGMLSAAEQVRFYKAHGYDGIVVTDHFFNGNSRITYEHGDKPWKERLDLFCKGYENAKAEGDRVGLKVWFGFEFNFHASEWLVYGIGIDFLKAHEEIMTMTPEQFLPFFRENGGFVIQAHPFREAPYISTMRVCYKLCDAMEIYNANNTARANNCAEYFANAFEIPPTYGSDCHGFNKTLCAVGSESEIGSLSELCQGILSRELALVKDIQI